MGDTFGQTVPKEETFTGQEGSLKTKTIGKLPPEQRQWADNVMKALGLQSQSSQARVLAGAISSAAKIEQNSNNEQEKKLARKLQAIVLDAGTPPWKDTKKAMAAGAAKVQLDLLSIPQDERSLKPLDPEKKGINQAFWIDRQDGEGKNQHTFLCKPAGKPGDETAPSGGPKGGEVAREALAGRAALLLSAQTGIDIGMPETHVVKLDSGLMGREPGEEVTCSVQEARKAKGDLKSLTPGDKRQMDAKQIAGLAIFDTLTLNTDRHAGNVLLDADGNLIPIDHGESFAESNGDGVGRIKGTLGGPHNALLSLPGAHEPMSPEMLKKLKAFKPDGFADGLKKDTLLIGGEHDDMSGAISKGAIENARRAGMFLKLAAKNEPPLSPAAIQVAMGNAADRLFGDAINEKTFLKNAKDAIVRMAPQQGTIKEVCTAPMAEYNELSKQIAALGWTAAPRNAAPLDYAVTDPLVMLKIIKDKIQAPPRRADQAVMLADLGAAPQDELVSPADSLDMLAENRQRTLNAVSAVMFPQDQRKITSDMRRFMNQKPSEKMRAHATLLEWAVPRALDYCQTQLTDLIADNEIEKMMEAKILVSTPSSITQTQRAIDNQDPVLAGANFELARTAAIKPATAKAIGVQLKSFGLRLMVPADDEDLKAGVAAAKGGDPFEAQKRLEALQRRKDELDGDVLKQMASDLDELLKIYAIPEDNETLARLNKALTESDRSSAYMLLADLARDALTDMFLPQEDGMREMALALEVPPNDEELQAAMNAVRKNKPEDALPLWQNVKKRAKEGEFGANAIDQLQKKLDKITNEFEIVESSDPYRPAKTAIEGKDAVKGRYYLDKLEKLTKKGVFPPKDN